MAQIDATRIERELNHFFNTNDIACRLSKQKTDELIKVINGQDVSQDISIASQHGLPTKNDALIVEIDKNVGNKLILVSKDASSQFLDLGKENGKRLVKVSIPVIFTFIE